MRLAKVFKSLPAKLKNTSRNMTAYHSVQAHTFHRENSELFVKGILQCEAYLIRPEKIVNHLPESIHNV